MSVPPTKIPIGGVVIRDIDTGNELDRLENWPNPFPVVGDMILTHRIWGRVKERFFRSYGHGWGVTIWIDAKDSGYHTAMFIKDNTNATT